MKVESVELTFFSTFPQFGLKVDEGFLVSKVLNDSLPQKTDSLLAFKECVLIVNPLDYFLKNKISVYNLSLKNVAVYAYRNKTGKANWEIVKIWGIERSGFFNGREKWAKGFENQRV